MKRRPIWLAIIGIPLLIITLKYGECCIQESSFAQAKTHFPTMKSLTTAKDSVIYSIPFWGKVVRVEHDSISFPKVFILGFEAGVQYGLAAHLMEPKHDYEQIASYAKSWFVYNQLADSTDFIQLPVIGKNHTIIFKANKKVK